MSRFDELRLIVRVTRMYYEQGLRQPAIADKLGISQATVSRLLNRSKDEGIIRYSISIPQGVYSRLEEELIQKYGLRDAIVVDVSEDDDERQVEREIGAAAAYYLESVLRQNEVIGISSWSATLLALVDAMQAETKKSGIKVIQILGGIGNPSAEVHANRLTGRLADLVRGTPVYLPAPGIVGSEAALKVILEDKFVKEAILKFDTVSTALVGIGALEPSKLLAQSGNVFSASELELLRKSGAVGDVLLRFFDAFGKPLKTPLDNRVISMSLDQLRKVDRSIGVAGGQRKYAAILGALRGGLINILITDHFSAARLIETKA